MERRITYLLPVELVNQIHIKFGSTFFSDSEHAFELSEFERKVFVDSNALGQRVNGPTVLQDSPDLDLPPIPEFGIQFACRSDQDSVKKSLKLRRSALAYCGWLVQQEEFHSDLENLKRDFLEELINGGLPQQADYRFPSHPPNETSLLAQELKKLCSKWRIAHFSTIEMPIPLQPSLISLETNELQSHEGLIVYAMPDIFPFSGNGEVVEEFESHRRQAEAPHLESWFELVNSSSRTRKRLITYARQFQVQHYWRVLLSRHSEKMKRKKTALKEMFGNVFDVSRDTILADFRELEKAPVKPLEIALEHFF